MGADCARAGGPDFEIDVRSNRFSRGLYATVGIKALSRLSVDVEARNRTAGFDSDAIFEGTYLSETLNRRERSGIVSVRWRRTALTTIVLASEVREVRFLRSPDRDSDNLISTVGAEFHSRALISGSGRIGIRHFRARGAAVTDISSVVAQADLSYRISRNTAVTFTAERDINYSFERRTRKARGKTVGLKLTEDELGLYREWIENNRELERLVEEMRRISSRVLALITGRQAP